jgi:hypothetical protein
VIRLRIAAELTLISWPTGDAIEGGFQDRCRSLMNE